MAYSDANPYSFGLRQVMIVSDDGLTKVDMPAPMTFEFTEEHVTSELDAADKTVATVAFPKKLTWTMESGGIPLEALEVMLGETVQTAGSTPNQTKSFTRNAGTSSPYFKLIGRSIGDSGDAVWVEIPKAKVTSFSGNFGQEEFFVSNLEGDALDTGSGLYTVTHYETDLPIT